jgi:hypothetical protein
LVFSCSVNCVEIVVRLVACDDERERESAAHGVRERSFGHDLGLMMMTMGVMMMVVGESGLLP